MLKRNLVTRSIAMAILGLAVAPPAAPQAAPRREPTEATRYNRSNEIKVTGAIERVETVDGETIIWMHARGVEKKGFGARPGTEAPGDGKSWRVEGPGIGKIKSEDLPKLVPGNKIAVTGYNSADTACKDFCRMQAQSVRF